MYVSRYLEFNVENFIIRQCATRQKKIAGTLEIKHVSIEGFQVSVAPGAAYSRTRSIRAGPLPTGTNAETNNQEMERRKFESIKILSLY